MRLLIVLTTVFSSALIAAQCTAGETITPQPSWRLLPDYQNEYQPTVELRNTGNVMGRNASEIDPLPPEIGTSVPTLLSPAANAVVSNGHLNGRGRVAWNFRWTALTGAERYEIYVKRQGSNHPVIHTTTSATNYSHSSHGSYIVDANLNGWYWTVRAIRNGQKLDWAPSQAFSVEPAARTTTTHQGNWKPQSDWQPVRHNHNWRNHRQPNNSWDPMNDQLGFGVLLLLDKLGVPLGE